MEKYYLYRHIRLDKNEPFYIGIGTIRNKSTIAGIYERAYDKVGRNKIWKDIFKKTEYEIEILIESESHEFIIEREKEFISLYGRIFNHTGILANISDGGEGASGIKGEDNHKSIKVYQYSLDGSFIREWCNAEEVYRELQYSASMIHRCCKGHIMSAKGYLWSYEHKDSIDKYIPYKRPVKEKIKKVDERTRIVRAINNITKEVIEVRAKNMKELTNKVKISEATIYRIMRGVTNIKTDWTFEKLESPAKRIESTLALEKIFV